MILLIYLVVLTQFLIFPGYFEFTIKKHETLIENSPIQIYPNKSKNRIAFKRKTGYKLALFNEINNEIIRKYKKRY